MRFFAALFFIVTVLGFSQDIQVSSPVVKQGDFFILTLPADFDGEISLSGITTSIKVYRDPQRSTALIPVHYSTPVGDYSLDVVSVSGEKYHIPISVSDGNFEKSYITVDPSMKEKRSAENVKTMVSYTRKARSSSSEEKLWEGNFIFPMEKRISSPFGAMRFINERISGYHSGIDFAAPIGTPVKAVNSGRIALAMHLASSGNTIIIDHGCNLFSSYSHLDSLKVSSGDTVEKGSLIGFSGNTGFTTGPHLHFTMSIGNIFINPLLLIGKTLMED